MQRIVFTAADLARIRLRRSLGPVAEGAFAIGALTGSRNVEYTRWRSDVLRRLREDPQLYKQWDPRLRSLKSADDLLFLLNSRAERDTSGSGSSLTRSEATRLAMDMWRIGVVPYRDRILDRLSTECDAHGRIAMSGGVEQLLTTLHPRIVWNAPVLEIHDGPALDIRLNGRGLLLTPSVFMAGGVGRVVEADRESDSAALVFAVPPGIADLFRVAERVEPDCGRALTGLVGRTRAAALRALTDACTTSQLAALLDVSPSAASQHASVLRDSGLVTSRRVRNSVLHSVTPLGRELLGGRLREAVRAGSRLGASSAAS
ncbi:ArsR/SmtB family transcription factor [Streptomyces sp. NPDC091272]|uniref:ArsR/SmtB family transcription factor n=1 Tax=Streptomyces sp. NPDC091272 TaxID=3365981 RepID=UPI003827DE04